MSDVDWRWFLEYIGIQYLPESMLLSWSCRGICLFYLSFLIYYIKCLIIFFIILLMCVKYIAVFFITDIVFYVIFFLAQSNQMFINFIDIFKKLGMGFIDFPYYSWLIFTLYLHYCLSFIYFGFNLFFL